MPVEKSARELFDKLNDGRCPLCRTELDDMWICKNEQCKKDWIKTACRLKLVANSDLDPVAEPSPIWTPGEDRGGKLII